MKRSTHIFIPYTDESASSPCVYIAIPTCIDRVNGYICYCSNGYEGTSRENGKSHIGIA